MKIATWNVNSLAVRLPQLLDWLRAHQPDAVCLQETKLTDDKFPRAELVDAGYHVECFGQKTYNGVALLSKTPATDVLRNIPGHDDAQARVIAGTVDGVRLVGVYVPNGQSVESDKFPYKLAWLAALRAWLLTEQAAHPQLALLGDYNIAPEDRDVHDPVLWAGQVLCTPEERAHFKALIAGGLHDAFRLFEAGPKHFTWWDYRMLGFQKNKGLRIDHVLVSEALKARVTSCVIDRPTRKNDRPSDHAPVIIEIH
ncbi:MAG TPA: exodeoxyribonuclease III [Burkholderiaceae bacterium]|nr:exodeoxyribonuclease III [Burkholderiaceae bacterium]